MQFISFFCLFVFEMKYASDVYSLFLEINPVKDNFKDKQSFKKCEIMHLVKNRNIDPSKNAASAKQHSSER